MLVLLESSAIGRHMLLLGAVFLAGVLHGLGPDHLAAITAFGAAGGRFGRLTFFSLRFAAGHAAVILLAGLTGFFGLHLLPPGWELGFELGTGGLLVVVGVVLLVGLLTGRIVVHTHAHDHAAGRHGHYHVHLLDRPGHRHVHGSFAAALGVLFALGGTRSLLAIAPIALATTVAESLVRVSAFACGIVVSMVAYGWLAGSAVERFARVSGPSPDQACSSLWFPRAAYALTGGFSLAAGLFTILSGLRG